MVFHWLIFKLFAAINLLNITDFAEFVPTICIFLKWMLCLLSSPLVLDRHRIEIAKNLF